MSSPWSSLCALRAAFAGFVALSRALVAAAAAERRGDDADVHVVHGRELGLVARVGHVPFGSSLPCVRVAVRVDAVRRRPAALIMFGTASARRVCLSPIDAELSIMNSRSTLSIGLVVHDRRERSCSCSGSALHDGRGPDSPRPRMPSDPEDGRHDGPCLNVRFMIALSFENSRRPNDYRARNAGQSLTTRAGPSEEGRRARRAYTPASQCAQAGLVPQLRYGKRRASATKASTRLALALRRWRGSTLVERGNAARSALTCRAVTPGTARSVASSAARMAATFPTCCRRAFFVLSPRPFTSSSGEWKRRFLPMRIARAVREAVRLVAQAREEEERRRAALQRDRVLLARQVHAVDERLAGEVLALLGEGDDGQVVQPEVVRRGQRHRELPASAVDDEEVRRVPRRVALALRAVPSASACGSSSALIARRKRRASTSYIEP